MRSLVVLLFLHLLFLSACSHKEIIREKSATSEKDGTGIELSAKWVKVKATSIDLYITVKNKYPFSVVVADDAARLSRGNIDGIPKKNTPRWILKSGDTVDSVLTFKFAEPTTGAIVLKLDHVYKGQEISVAGSNTTEHGRAGAVGGRHVAIAVSEKEYKTEGYIKKSAVEGAMLPSVQLEIKSDVLLENKSVQPPREM